MAECPFCKETVGANDFLPDEGAACPSCGNRLRSAATPTSLAPPEPWWASAPLLESTEPPAAPAVPPAPSSEPWWVLPAPPVASESLTIPPPADASNTPSVSVPDEVKEPPADPPPPAEAPAPAERSEPESIQAAPPPPLPPSRNEPSIVRPRPRAAPTVPEEPDEPMTLVDRLRSLDPGTAIAFLCLSLALLSVSLEQVDFLVKPLAVLGLLVGLLGGVLPSLRKGMKVVAPAVVSILCLLVLLFVGSWPVSPPEPPSTVAVSLKETGMAAHQPTGEDEWVDASASAVQRRDVRVQVISARIGSVELKKGASVSSSPDRYLAIRLRTSYEGVVFQQTPYEPWADLPDAPSKHAPTLADDQGHTYAQKTFESGWKVVGRADVDGLTPGHQVKEVLVFPVPPGDVKELRLTLPASAFGLDGEFRFRIPRGMIQGR